MKNKQEQNLELKNAELEKELAATKRDLEIEAALERVRTIAMGMNQSDDLLSICETMFHELKTLGFNDLRNAMISIHYDEKQYLLNYEYRESVGKTVIKVIYNSHPIVNNLVDHAEQSSEGFTEQVYAGEALDEWRAFRKGNGKEDDPRLYNISALYYYFYSIGTGAVGISTFSAANRGQLEVLKRFRNVFDLAYKRYIDITNAEAQAREAQIELGLERVRARAMAMQSSDELAHLVTTLFNELSKLHITFTRCMIWLMDNDALSATVWMADPVADKAFSSRMQFLDLAYHTAFIKAWKERKQQWAYELKGDEKQVLNNLIFSMPGTANTPEEVKAAMIAAEHVTLSFSFSNFGGLQVDGDGLLSEDNSDILSRFSKVFDQTYTRFSDLKKAEAQAREALIEGALERVRSRAMAMHKTDELLESAELLPKELTGLGIGSVTVCYVLVNEKDKTGAYYGVNPIDGKIKSQATIMPHTETKVMRALWASWLKQEPVHFIALDPEASIVHQTYIGKLMAATFAAHGIAPEFTVEGFLSVSPERIHIYSLNFKQGYLFLVGATPLAAADVDILIRFTKVFELTYTRFLDIQKAEAQAREGRIELALERVRARTMAMQHSDELAETAYILFQQFRELGENPDQATIGIINEAERVIEYWVTIHGNQTDRVYKFPVDEPNVTHKIYKAWKKHEKLLVIDLTSKALHDFSKFRESMGGAGYNPGEKRRIINVAFFSKGLINVQSTVERSVESLRLLERFANVFEGTYTRFLDLKKAEAQARDAQIELALERVRARAMAMRDSKELSGMVSTVFGELTKLDFALTRCAIAIADSESGGRMIWMANSEAGQPPISFYRKSLDHPYPNAANEEWKKRTPKWVYHLKGAEKKAMVHYYANSEEVAHMPSVIRQAMDMPESIILSHSFNNFGYLRADSLEPLSEANLDILYRFAKVFDLGYTRFTDIKQAEAQAREAQIELALERVRAKTMAMQHSNELLETSQVVFQQLRDLGETADQIGIAIVKEDEGVFDLFATLYGTQMVRVFQPKIDDHFIMGRVYKNWKAHKKSFVVEIGGEQLLQYNILRNQMGGQNYYNEEIGPDDRWIVSAACFSKGILSFSSSTPPTKEATELLERFAKVFEQTYTRFIDLQRAEAQARESQIQLALERVRARTMAMQQSTELAETASLVSQQLQALGLSFPRVGFYIWKRDAGLVEGWTSNGNFDDLLPPLILPSMEDDGHRGIYEAAQKGEHSYEQVLSGDELKQHYKWLLSQPSVADTLRTANDGELLRMQIQYKYAGIFKQGYLMLIATEPQPGAGDLLERFALVFEQTYTRFLDLQKAELQSRESQIELSLERVRARTMAMQKSDELQEIIKVVYEQLVHLNILVEHAGFIMDYNTRDDMHIWLADKHYAPTEITVPYFDSPHWNDFNEAKQKGSNFFAIYSGFEEKNRFYQDLFKLIPGVTDETKEYYFSCPGLAISTVLLENVSLYIENFAGIPYTDDENGTLMRFGKVFQQTYTRFLDLKHAEEQAREAQIQLALERVRARTMAMQKSDELAETVSLLFKQLLGLGIRTEQIRTCGIVTFDDKKPVGEQWITETNGEIIPKSFMVPYDEAPAYKAIYKGWKDGEKFKLIHLEGKALKEHLGYLSKGTNVPVRDVVLPQQAMEIFNHVMYFSQGCLFIITKEALPEYHDVFKRFGAVFQQSYTRFLDLKKAEEQARESQIELALERVRARAMAMQRSDELKDVVAVVLEKLIELKVTLVGSSVIIGTAVEGTKDTIHWVANPAVLSSAVSLYVPYHDHPLFAETYTAFASGRDFFSRAYTFEEKNILFKFLFEHSDYKYLPDHTKNLALTAESFVYSIAFQKNSTISVSDFTGKLLSETEIQLLKRFSKVFEQSYIRFLDLQRAEAQAREAQIEASLERVRGKAMAMRNSGDLSAAASTVFAELRNLGINPIRSGVGLLSKDNQKVKLYSNTSSATATHLSLMGEIDTSCHPLFEPQYQAWLKQKNYFVALGGKELATYYKILSGALNADLNISVKKSQKEYGHWFVFSEGFLYAWSDKEYTDAEMKILERFKNVIELTFRRYIELQNSEAQARDAVRQASLDRVRAEIASMRTISDLDRITPLIWNELTILGVPFIRCGVFIMDEPQQLIHTYLSTPDGKAIAAFQLHFNSDTGNGVNQTALRGWREKQMVNLHWTEEEFKNFSHALVEQGEIASEEGYLTERPPSGLDLHFFPFLQGMLYAGNTEPLSEDDKDLVQSLADAFSTAYARYEDFYSLELAKKEVERTLTDLRTAQTRLIQSEKMASLGELTAGIAHEIQNPLNFVNNFSEVNQDLLEELKAESLKPKAERDDQLEIELINDLINNEQKINHHGKRADGIVKGMLQHSRTAGGEKLPTNINSVAEEYMRLSYHGLRAKDKGFNAEMIMNFDPELPKIQAVGQDIGRVMLNLFNNAFYAINQKSKKGAAGYKPEVSVTTSAEDGQVIIKVKDNGVGMPEQVKEKIMQPFFTTKPTGEGTGLGLSLTYDMVVKGHGGSIQVNSVEGEGSEFIITLPIS